MSIVLKPGMNLRAFSEELKTLVEKHGGIVKHEPKIQMHTPEISNVPYGPYNRLAAEERSHIEIELRILVESVEVVAGWRGV